MKLTTMTLAVLIAVPGAAFAQGAVEDGWITTRADDAVEARGTRLRFGVNVGWSPFTNVRAPGRSRGSEGMVSFGVHLRAGIQFNDYVAAYYQASGMMGDTVKVCASTGFGWNGSRTYDPAGCTNYWVPVHTSSLLLETALAHKAQLAVGPSVLYGFFGNAPIGSSPVGGGAIGRITGVFAGKEEGSMRRSVSVGLQGQAGFFPAGGQLLNLEIFVGYELF